MKKSGFTLLELLATIIILGLLTTIVIGVILPLLNRGNDEYYKNQENMLVLAARDYFADHRSRLPKEIGETSTVTLKELIEGKYIDPIKDKEGVDCDLEKSTVVVQKITEKDYQYYVTLVCNGDNDNEEDDPTYESEKDKQKPTIVFNPNKESSTNPINIKMIMKDNKGIASYRYVVEKDGSEYYDSEYQNYTTDPTINLTEKGTYRITGYAIDTGGNETTKKSREYEIYEGISCSEVNFESNIESETWSKETIEVDITVPSNTYRYEIETKKDNGTYQLEKTVIGNAKTKISLTNTGNYQLRVTVYDRDGSSCSKESEAYYVDKTPPSCPTITSTTNANSWTKNNITLTIKPASDTVEWEWSYKNTMNNSDYTTPVTHAGSTPVNKTYMSTGKWQGKIKVTDEAGNSQVCNTSTYYIDKNPPDVSNPTKIIGGGDTGQTFSFYIKYTYSDNESGLGRRYIKWVTHGNSVHSADGNYGGDPNGKDEVGTWGNSIQIIEYSIWDMAGNVTYPSRGTLYK